LQSRNEITEKERRMATEVTMPRLSDSMEEGTVVEWLVAEGDAVTRGQPIVEIETDKATMPFEAEQDGVLLKILVPTGETASLGAAICVIGAEGEEVPDGGDGGSVSDFAISAEAPTSPSYSEAAEAPSSAPAPNGTGGAGTGGAATITPPIAPNGRSGRVAASPLARRVAASLGIDLASVHGSGPGGRVVRADVEAAAASPAQAAPALAPAPVDRPAPAEAIEAAAAPEPQAAPAAGASVDTRKGAVETHKLSRSQQTVARRMAESRATVPEFELRVDVDMGACVELREQLRSLGADPLPSYNDMIVKASSVALREFPRVNAAYKDDAFEHYERVNVGVAVAAEDALVVPTVADADQKSLGEIARVTRQLATKVRDGSVTPPELSGGTFTVSNLGMFGIDSFSAVINAPQAAILAVGAMKKKPVVDETEQVVVRPVLTLTLACDHRILYGADGARFLSRLRDLLEQPLAFAL
jgi:pyruvate dehydrogenase E2 component (dihydrolipoamide acetyltransferase)